MGLFRLTDCLWFPDWMAQEQPEEVNALLVRWLATEVPTAWPTAVAAKL